MNRCKDCKTAKSPDEFHRDRSRNTGRSNRCVGCENERTRARAAAVRAKVAGLKTGPCVDCGGRFPPEAMDFDHLPGETKAFELSRAHRHPWDKVLAEAAKCELVCANCHRVRTTARWRA